MRYDKEEFPHPPSGQRIFGLFGLEKAACRAHLICALKPPSAAISLQGPSLADPDRLGGGRPFSVPPASGTTAQP